MPIERPPLLCLGGEEAFAAYKAEFDRLYRAGPVLDVLGQLVLFRSEDCRHVCYKEHRDDVYKTGPRGVWKQARAERIPWIYSALTDPRTEVRTDRERAGDLLYLCIFDGEPQEPYCVAVHKSGKSEGFFMSAYPVSNQKGHPDWSKDGWQKKRRKGPVIWPPK